MTGSLETAETRYQPIGDEPVSRRAAAVAARGMRRPLLPDGTPAEGETVDVYVNHGRWVVDCPFCNSAQVASLTDRRFLCADCFNLPLKQMLAVTWPAEYAAIEAELLLRPNPETRNWRPGETVDDLIREREAAEQGEPAPVSSQDALLARIEALEALLTQR